MDMKHVLLSSKGRIGPRVFLRGLIVLTAVFILVQMAGNFVSPLFGLLAYPMVYAYACLFSKRLHDAGHSGWLFLLFLLGYFVANMIITGLFLPILSPVAFEAYSVFGQDLAGLMEAMRTQSEEFEHLTALPTQSSLLLTTLTSFLLTSALLGFIASRLPSDPGPNRYGPPHASSAPHS